MLSIVQKKDELGIAGLIIKSLKGTVAGVCTVAVLALILPAVLLRFQDPGKFIAPFAYVALFVGALICGIVTGRQGAITSLIAGAGYVLLLWLLSLVLGGGTNESVGFLWKIIGYVCCVAVSFLGGTAVKGRKRHSGEGKKNPTAILRRQLDRRQ